MAGALDALINVDMMVDQLQEMTHRIRNGETSTFNPEKWEPETWPSSCKGVGLGWKRPVERLMPLGAD